MLVRSRYGLSAVVLGCLLGILVGCDIVEREGNVGPLLGAWQTEDFLVDGISVEAQLDAQYARLVLTLREGANGGRYFTIIGREEGPEEDLFVQGTFDVDSDREVTLFPDTGPRVEFEYSIPDSLNAELRLSAEEGVSEDQFLNLIQLRIQGAVDRVEIHLSKGGTASATVGSPSVPFKSHVAGIYAAEGEGLWEGEWTFIL